MVPWWHVLVTLDTHITLWKHGVMVADSGISTGTYREPYPTPLYYSTIEHSVRIYGTMVAGIGNRIYTYYPIETWCHGGRFWHIHRHI